MSYFRGYRFLCLCKQWAKGTYEEQGEPPRRGEKAPQLQYALCVHRRPDLKGNERCGKTLLEAEIARLTAAGAGAPKGMGLVVEPVKKPRRKAVAEGAA